MSTLTNSRNKKRTIGSKTLESKLKTSDPVFVDFVQQCLNWLPEDRLRPDMALRHEFIRKKIV